MSTPNLIQYEPARRIARYIVFERVSERPETYLRMTHATEERMAIGYACGCGQCTCCATKAQGRNLPKVIMPGDNLP